MQKNTILFLVFSMSALFLWYLFTAPQQVPQQNMQDETAQTATVETAQISGKSQTQLSPDFEKHNIEKEFIDEKEIFVETDLYKATFSNRGAAILSWSIKEKNGNWVDLVLPQAAPVIANFPGSNYKIISSSNEKLIFEHISNEGWKITKTFTLSQDSYMHKLDINIQKLTENAKLPQIELEWGPGLGTDQKEQKENTITTRALAYTAEQAGRLKKLKKDPEQAAFYKWAAIDNRYFLAAFIPENPSDFDKIIPSKLGKKYPYSLNITAIEPKESTEKTYSLHFYLGPKGYTYLKTYNLGLEKSVDFGFFGFLGKAAFFMLATLHKITSNYGWAIILLTLFIQVLILPLTLKSLRAAATMKRVQPLIQEIQTKFKDNPQRLQVEMLNVYKTQKVNPLGGCLPMLLQLPIFWAFFTMLRNAYELRGEPWILWVKDLSIADQFLQLPFLNINLLPLIMGLGMFFQQKMTAAVSDPTQKRIMYIMPIIFTVMFWTFPSGLVLYWLTNSVVSMVLQFIVLKKEDAKVKKA